MPNHADFDRARAWLSRFETGLRAGDPLHLAIASNRGAEAIYSLDKLMIAAGKTLGVPTRARGLLPSYDD
ncbi:MAG: type II toxin-antitoxin system VapC family toxin [Boseongicola sp. SB0675_bin_26]|nr:type II toxin-antitoxin system VapC family toxin [Boseongicola sp. SB0675_bin_26]